jgi:putative flippase GtrA
MLMSSKMHSLGRWALRNWPQHREKVRYLLVGGWNTLFVYTCFSTLYFLLNERLAPSLILAIAYGVASINGYMTFRLFVFAPVRHPVVEYLRYQAVYVPIQAFNLVALPLALMHTNLSAYIVQALLAPSTVIAAYLGNKYFTFRAQTRS